MSEQVQVISDDEEEETINEEIGRDVGMLDQGRGFRCVESKLTSSRNKNCKWKCVYCNETGFADSERAPHMELRHVEHFKKLTQKGWTGPPNMATTARELNRAIMIMICVLKFAFRIVDTPAFKHLIMTAIEFGRNIDSRTYQVPSRRTLLDNVFEGKTGVLAEAVADKLALMTESARLSGLWISSDSATDVNGVGQEVMVIQGKNSSALFFAAHPHGKLKTAVWTARQIGGAIDGKVDWKTMSVPQSVNAEPILAEQITTNNSAKKANIEPQISGMLQDILGLGAHVFACVTDNCNAARATTKKLNETHALVEVGDVSHAISKTHEHLMDLPQVKQILDNVQLVVKLFSLSVPSGMLGRKPKRIITTRFITSHLVLQDQDNNRDLLLELVAKIDFKEWVKGQGASVKDLCAKVQAILNDDEHYEMVRFLLDVGQGFVTMVRLFDGTKVGSVCLVYKMWSMLASSLDSAFKASWGKGFVNQELRYAFHDKVMENWRKFHYPVFSLGFLAANQNRDEWLRMYNEEEEQYAQLVQDAIYVGKTVLRRFAIESNGKLREVILAEDDPVLEKHAEVFEKQLCDYLVKDGMFRDIQMSKKVSPFYFWVHKAPSCLFTKVMRFICTLAPSTCAVERIHKLFKLTRTKSRNRIDYHRAFAVNFVASSHGAKVTDPELDWEEISTFKDRIEKLTKTDLSFLDSIVEDANTFEQAVKEEAEEGQDAIAHEENESANDEEVSGESDKEDEPSQASVTTRSGRVVRKKLFPDFIT